MGEKIRSMLWGNLIGVNEWILTHSEVFVAFPKSMAVPGDHFKSA
jgi:hypothetical protein